MNAPEAVLIGLAAVNVAMAGVNFWNARRNVRTAKLNSKAATQIVQDAQLILNHAGRVAEATRQLHDLHRARMAVYSAVEAHIRALGED